MITYMINFVLCSGLLLLVYYLFLASENLYRFNRFYLVFSLVFSLTIPLITIELPRAKLPAFEQQIIEQRVSYTTVSPITQNAIQPVQVHNYVPDVLLVIYGIIAVVLLARFCRNLYVIKQSISRNTVLKYQGTNLVLLDEDITPHSFLNYVFINKGDYTNELIEPEIICHERAHVNQLHTVDVLFIELLQIICWFNPLIPFYRRAVQLNHEFLADDAVIRNYENTPAYQYLLVAKASQSGSLYLTSQFNYLTIKKRLIMMTKTTSAKMALCKQLALVPVLAGTLLLFCQKGTAQTTPGKVTPDSKIIPAAKQDAPKSITDEYADILKKYGFPLSPVPKAQSNGKKIPIALSFSQADHQKLESLYKQMSKEQQKQQFIRFVPPPAPLSKSYPTDQQLAEWKADAVKYGIWINDKRIKNVELANYSAADFDLFMFSRLTPVAIKNDGFHYQVALMTKDYYANYRRQTLAKKDWLIVHNQRIVSKI